MIRARIAAAALLLALAALVLARRAPPVVTIEDIGVTELYVDLASHGRLLVGPYSRFRWHHPGPLYFYLQAPLYAASGRNGAALFAGASAINVAAFLVMLWILRAERCAALAIAVGAAVLVLAWRLPQLLASPWTAHVPILPYLAFLTTAAAAAAGRTGVLPAAIFLASLVVQTNVALAPAVAVPLALAAPAAVRALRSHGAANTHAVLALAVALIVWLPTAIDVVVNHGGNVAALWSFFAAGGTRHTPGEAFSAWAFSTAGLMRPNLELAWGKPLDPSGAPWTAAAAVALTLLTAGVTLFWRRRRRAFETWLGAMVTCAAVVTLWSLTRILEPIGDYHVLSATALGACAAGIVLAGAMQAASRGVESDIGQRVAGTAAVIMSIAAATLAFVHFQRAVSLQQRLPWAADVVPAVERIEAYLDAHPARAVVLDVDRAWSQGVPIVLRLRQHHRRVAVTRGNLFMFTNALAPTGREDGWLGIQPGRQPAPAGRAVVFDSPTVSVLARAPE